jgi:two-component system response regulator DctR
MTLIHIIDDDDAVRDSLAFLISSRGHVTRQHPSAEAFLALPREQRNGVIVLDIRMDGMSGIELFHEIKKTPPMPVVIFLTGHGDVPLAVEAVKAGAFDFREKPFEDGMFLEIVDRAVALASAGQGIGERMASLTSRERDVMDLLLADLPNKAIAHKLGITVRTVEVHRARVLDKMQVRSVVALAGAVKQP